MVASSSGQDSQQRYLCNRTDRTVQIDGVLDEPAWSATAWTGNFVDIEGDVKPTPRFRTRVKMLWDAEYFYIAAEMEEPHLWATLEKRDSVIYRDNDFEVFIDPGGDAIDYYELEINALGTVWDLMLDRPYREGGTANSAWDIAGLKAAVHLDGTLNDPGDRDRGWSVELAFPWSVLAQYAPAGRAPVVGETWRINFSRVQWPLVVRNGRYEKRLDADTGRPLREDNWVWSPQGAVNMHIPERWGSVTFAGDRTEGTRRGSGSSPGHDLYDYSDDGPGDDPGRSPDHRPGRGPGRGPQS
jgi:hypothetical protein